MFYKRRIAKQDMPADIAERFAYAKARDQAMAEMRKKFGLLTKDNLEEADRFVKNRIREIQSQ